MILVTGASGLVGLHLIKYLSQNNEKVRALYHTHLPNTLANTNEENIEWQCCDILDIVTLEAMFVGVLQVYHCSGIVSYDPRLTDYMMEVNETGTEYIVNFCLEKNVQKLVFVSSIAALGKDTNEQNMISEKSEWSIVEQNVSKYAMSKHKAEMQVWRGIAEGLHAVIVNPAVILGEGDVRKSSTNLFEIVHDEFKYFTKGSTAWVDVQDVVKAMYMLMQSDVQNERFVLSAGNYSYKEIFTKMARSMGVKPPSVFATKGMTELVWRWSYIKSKLTGKVATITKETARNAHEINHFDNSKFLMFFPEFTYQNIYKTIERVCTFLYGQ